jgi:3-hydroxybutyrate dehydrogenase
MAVDFGLQGQVAIVTGSTSGIGHAMADALAAQGVNIVLNGLGEMTAIEKTRAELAEKHGVEVLYNGADMTKPGQIADMVKAAKAEFGELDILVNNAGVQHVAPIEDFPEDRWDTIVALLLTSPFLLAKHAWPALKASGGGRFIAIASAHALAASPYKAAYVSAKHGVLGLVKTLALEGAEHGITATAVCPGYVRTPLVERQIPDQAKAHGVSEEEALSEVILAPHAIKRLIEPEEVANVVAFLAGPGGSAFTGVPVTMDLGWTAR